MKKIKQFINDVKKEIKKVKFSSKKDMLAYTVATISFIVIFALFFTTTDFVLAFFKQLLVK